MNLPNKITLSRILLVPIFMLFIIPIPEWVVNMGILKEQLLTYNSFVANFGNVIAAIIFILASSTDAIDGYIARKHHLITNLGKFLDPIADKLLVTAALLALVQGGKISSWSAMIIIGREFIVTGLRLVAAGEGIVISASNLGKIKTIAQMIAIIFALLNNYPFAVIPSFYSVPIFQVAMGIALILTVYSGYDYVKKNIDAIIKHDLT